MFKGDLYLVRTSLQLKYVLKREQKKLPGTEKPVEPQKGEEGKVFPWRDAGVLLGPVCAGLFLTEGYISVALTVLGSESEVLCFPCC